MPAHCSSATSVHSSTRVMCRSRRRRRRLSLDATLLAELLGKDGIKQLLDADIIASIEADLQCLSAERQVTRWNRRLTCCVRPDQPRPELAARAVPGLDTAEVIDTLIGIAAWSSSGSPGRRCWPLPRTFRDCVTASEFRFRQVWRRRSPRLLSIPSMILYCVGHAPTARSSPSIAQRYGLGRAIVESACDGLVAPGTLVAGSFVDLPGEARRTSPVLPQSSAGLIKRRTLARLRKGVEPVEQIAFARFLAEWQGVGKAAAASMPCWGPLNSSRVIRCPPAPWSR